jgi:hypothetical protein
MRSPEFRYLRLTLTVLFLFAGFATISSPRPAQAGAPDGLNHFYFPWVPNNDQMNGFGPWYGKLSFQNLSDQTCPVSIFIGRTGSWSKVAQLAITAGASRSISSSSLAIPSPGAPVRLEAVCPLTASVKMVTPDVDSSPWSDGASVVTGYTGLSGADVAAAESDGAWNWYLPIVQTNSDWNTIIRVTNFDDDSGASVTVRLFPTDNENGAQGAIATLVDAIPPGGSKTFDVLGIVQTTGWVGFAEIVADEPVGAYAFRSKPLAGMAITNVATSGTPEPDSERYLLGAPLLFTAYNGWNTGINLANISNETANVTIRYFDVAGGLNRETQLILAPWTMQYIYTPNNVDEEDFVGGAIIESDQAISAAIDEVKYETTEAISYLASTVGQTDAAIPVTFREDPQNGLHDNSGINVQNLNPDAAQTVQIQLTTNVGEDVLPEPISLTMPPGGNNFVYLPNLADVPPGTVAAARITSQDPMGFVALSNDVNYAASGDGSVTFMAAGEAGYYRLLGAPEVPADSVASTP